MPMGKWALIDCHLPSDEDLDRFYRYVDGLNIVTLDYVVLTHADSDHYFGMADVLDRFSTHGRSVRFFCTSGTNHKHIRLLQEARGLSESEMKEYARLVTTVIRLSESKLLERQWLHNGTATIRIDGDTSGFSLVVVAPSTTVLANADDRALLGLRGARPNVNELSIVLIAQQGSPAAACRMFLPGDVEGDGLTKALTRWDVHPDNIASSADFDVVKVPHHGSVNGHDAALVARIAVKGVSVAAVSSGTRAGSPGSAVINDYLSMGWRVHCTSPRGTQSGASSALQLTAVGKAKSSNAHCDKFDIRIVADVNKAVEVDPAESRISDLMA